MGVYPLSASYAHRLPSHPTEYSIQPSREKWTEVTGPLCCWYSSSILQAVDGVRRNRENEAVEVSSRGGWHGEDPNETVVEPTHDDVFRGMKRH